MVALITAGEDPPPPTTTTQRPTYIHYYKYIQKNVQTDKGGRPYLTNPHTHRERLSRTHSIPTPKSYEFTLNMVNVISKIFQKCGRQ